MRTDIRAKSKSSFKRKILKKFNSFNIGICLFCIFVGYGVVAFFTSTQDNASKQNDLAVLNRSVDRIADSFELYNQKKFLDSMRPK